MKRGTWWIWAAFAIALLLLPTKGEASLFGRRAEPAVEKGEYLIVSGGPALKKWEKLRLAPHDLWWGNFIRSARIRMTELSKADPAVSITWFVYRPAYVSREAEEPQSRVADVESVPAMFARDYEHPIRLVWFDKTSQLINHINNRRRGEKVVGFEYFGHSNEHAFMFDYSNAISGASRCWLHVRDLGKLRRRSFQRGAFCKSWGCHSGKTFCPAFRRATGVSMWGATHKTDYSVLKDDRLPVVNWRGDWVLP